MEEGSDQVILYTPKVQGRSLVAAKTQLCSQWAARGSWFMWRLVVIREGP